MLCLKFNQNLIPFLLELKYKPYTAQELEEITKNIELHKELDPSSFGLSLNEMTYMLMTDQQIQESLNDTLEVLGNLGM